MNLTLASQLEAALKEQAQRQGTDPESLALQALRERFLPRPLPFEPQDEWERRLLEIGRPIGANLSDEDVSSEGIYD